MKPASGRKIWSSPDEGDSESMTKYYLQSNEKNVGVSTVKKHFESIYLKRNFLLSWSVFQVNILKFIGIYFYANSSRVIYVSKILNYRLVEFCQYISSDCMSPLKDTDSVKNYFETNQSFTAAVSDCKTHQYMYMFLDFT